MTPRTSPLERHRPEPSLRTLAASLAACVVLTVLLSQTPGARAQDPQAQPADATASQVAAAASQAASAAVAAASAAAQAASSIAEMRALVPKSESMKGDRLMLLSTAAGLTRLHARPAMTNASGVEIKPAAASSVVHYAAPRTELGVTQDGERLVVRVRYSPCDGRDTLTGARILGALPFAAEVGEGCLVQPQVEVGEAYEISRADLERYGYGQEGWVYGALLLPYKYRFRGENKGLDPSPTIGPYLGWRLREGAAGFSVVGSAGLASIRLPDENGRDGTRQGLTWAFGLMFDVSKSVKPFKTGLFVGRDYLGSDVPGFRGGPWVALQIGYDFSE